jgi:hypothetical protein
MTQREQLQAKLSGFSDDLLDTLRREVYRLPKCGERIPGWAIHQRREVGAAFDEVVSEIPQERKQAEHERLVALLRGVG